MCVRKGRYASYAWWRRPSTEIEALTIRMSSRSDINTKYDGIYSLFISLLRIVNIFFWGYKPKRLRARTKRL